MQDLVLILRDQLDRDAAIFEGVDGDQDVVAMTEGDTNRGRYPEHKHKLALSFAAMRHFRDDLRERKLRVEYESIDEVQGEGGIEAFLARQIEEMEPDRVRMTEPGRHSLLRTIREICEAAGIRLQVVADDHFLCSHREFGEWVEGRKELTMGYFYREQRRAHDVLMTDDGTPVGGEWNYDDQNRERFVREGPGELPARLSRGSDSVTSSALKAVERYFPDAPGSLESFGWPVTPVQAQGALDEFIQYRLPHFGPYQDAMWTGEPFLYHSCLSAALNLKLLDPMTAIRAAEQAYHDGHAPINSVEGFVRQILGWREFVRGVYWRYVPGYLELNALDATTDLPAFFWTGDTEMHCLRECVGQTLTYGYTHHIARLMVIGLFGLLYGVDPKQLNAWHEALYVDAWEWVSSPNMMGMALYADGGIVGSKPYAASGKYINRMSNYCSHCRYDPDAATGYEACPFTTLYWDFLDRHEDRLSSNRRMNFQLANLRRKDEDQRGAIGERVDEIRSAAVGGRL